MDDIDFGTQNIFFQNFKIPKIFFSTFFPHNSRNFDFSQLWSLALFRRLAWGRLWFASAALVSRKLRSLVKNKIKPTTWWNIQKCRRREVVNELLCCRITGRHEKRASLTEITCFETFWSAWTGTLKPLTLVFCYQTTMLILLPPKLSR